MTNRHPLWIVVSVVVVAACGGSVDAPPPPEDPSKGLVLEVPAGWHISDGPTQYTSVSLFEYLNGGAPLYLDFGFEGLTQTRYQMGDDPFASVTIDVYEMGSARAELETGGVRV